MTRQRYYVVDAFASQLFTGNPAGVCTRGSSPVAAGSSPARWTESGCVWACGRTAVEYLKGTISVP